MENNEIFDNDSFTESLKRLSWYTNGDVKESTISEGTIKQGVAYDYSLLDEFTKRNAYKDEKFEEQYAEFERIVQGMLKLHKDKMNDYSEWNMKGTGELGAIVRIWDKTARLMNLYGFDIGTGKFSGKVNPNFESIEDNLTDLANYAIITLILRKGKWGK